MLAAYALVSSRVETVCNVPRCMTERGADVVCQVTHQGQTHLSSAAA